MACLVVLYLDCYYARTPAADRELGFPAATLP